MISINVNLDPSGPRESFGEAMARMAAGYCESLGNQAVFRVVTETCESHACSAVATGAGPSTPRPHPQLPRRYSRQRRLALVRRWVLLEARRTARVAALWVEAAMHAKAAAVWSTVARMAEEGRCER